MTVHDSPMVVAGPITKVSLRVRLNLEKGACVRGQQNQAFPPVSSLQADDGRRSGERISYVTPATRVVALLIATDSSMPWR